MKTPFPACAACLIALALALGAGGCSSNRIVVKGQLKENGKAITLSEKDRVEMNFISEGDAQTSKSYLADINRADGTFKVKDIDGSGMPPGKYKVTVDFKSPYPMGPDRYAGKYSPRKSKLFIEVGSEPLEIDLVK